MLTHPLKMGCHLAQIERRHHGTYLRLLEKNRDRFRGVLHFIEAIKDGKDMEEFILSASRKMIEGRLVFWGIWSGRDLIGVVSARDIDEDLKSAELGYFIDGDYEGKGIVSQACGILIEHVFREFDVERLVLACDVGNVRSRRIADRFGFTLEGVARKGFVADGAFIDCAVHSLLRSEYGRQPARGE